MRVLVAALLYVPGIIVAALLWTRLSQPGSSSRYSAVAVAVSISGFLAVQFLISFLVASSTPDADCLEPTDCQLQGIAGAFRWWFLGLSLIFGALAYMGIKYCTRISLRK
jgi:hypothetical protein